MAALAAGALYPFAFSPFDIWPLAVLSTAWLIYLADRRSVLRFYLYAVGAYGVGTSWIYVSIHVHGYAPPPLAGFLVLLFVLAVSIPFLLQGYLYQRLVKGLPLGLLLGFPALWCLREWLYTWVLTGFPWLFAGYPHLDTPLSGYVPMLGVVGTGFVAVLVAVCVVQILRRQRIILHLGVVLVAFLLGYGLAQWHMVDPIGQPLRVSSIQGNIPQETKWLPQTRRTNVTTHLTLTASEWGRDIIVWPEASITYLRSTAQSLLSQIDEQGKKAGSADCRYSRQE
jgi:apolipoprotein N-acyltransferase